MSVTEAQRKLTAFSVAYVQDQRGFIAQRSATPIPVILRRSLLWRASHYQRKQAREWWRRKHYRPNYRKQPIQYVRYADHTLENAWWRK